MSTTKNNPLLSIPESEIKKSKTLKPLSEIAARIIGNQEPFEVYKFLQGFLTAWIRSGELDGWDEETLRDMANKFEILSDVIFDLEMHNLDYFQSLAIRQYMHHVNNASDEEQEQCRANIKTLVDRYGSLENGLSNLADYKR